MTQKEYERLESIRLRKAGMSVCKIASELSVSKGSVSLWVKGIPQPEQFTKEYKARKKTERLDSIKAAREKIKREKYKIPKDKPIPARPMKDRIISGDGRWMVPAPEGYGGKKYIGDRYVYEHRLIMEIKIGRLLNPGEVVHHINENKMDNRIGNLELKNHKDHCRQHYNLCTPAEYLHLICKKCGVSFKRLKQVHKSRMKIGYKYSFCCLSHAISFAQKERWEKIKIGR